MTYFNMRKRIAMLEKNQNTVDYPDNMMHKKPWTFNYLTELYECSVNGARSPKAIAHLKRVANTLYISIIALVIVVSAILFILTYVLGVREGKGHA